MKLEMYPLMELPFDSYCKLLDLYKDSLNQFIPSTMEEDLKTGRLNRMVYWYPRLVLKLYDLSYDGLDFRGYLDSLHECNSLFFEDIFAGTTKKLDVLREKNVKKNHFEEIVVKDGKIK